MKRDFKFLSMWFAVTACFAFMACGSDDDNVSENAIKNAIETGWFTVENAEYVASDMPESTTETALEGVYGNNQALSNGGNFITISSQTKYGRFYVGVEGVQGYYDIEVVNSQTGAGNDTEYFNYTIPVNYSVDLGDDFVLVISGVTLEGYITPKYTQEITYVESLDGDLLVNLVFDRPKDVDLHLIMPSGREIYYGNRGDYGYDEEIQLFGLDHDSNPSCSIDNLNNENISIPVDYVEKGKYTVIVNLYANCNNDFPVNYSLQARYKGELLKNLLPESVNPVRGYYRADAGTHDRTVVMEFELTEGKDVENGYNPEESQNLRRRIPLSLSAKAKLMMKDEF